MGERTAGRTVGVVTLHQRLIELLRSEYPAGETKHFKVHLLKALEDGEACGELIDGVRKITIRPDMHIIDQKSKHVSLFEVEVHCHIKGRKAFELCDILGLFDNDEEWSMELITVDRAGRTRDMTWIDLLWREEECARLEV